MDKEIEPAQAPTTPAPTNPPPQSVKKEVDLGAILLPKKEVHDPLNAPRVEAGVLLKQEQTAELPKTPVTPLPTPPRNDSIVQPLETYQSDMQKYIQKNNVSNVTIAAAEAERRGKGEGVVVSTPQTGSFWFKLGMIFLGSLLVGGAVGIVGYVVYQLQALPAAINPQAPVIAIDEVQTVAISPNDSHAAALDKLAKAKDVIKLSVGLVAHLVPISSTSTTQAPLDGKIFFGILAPNMPRELARTLLPTFLVGVHSFDRNQPFLLFKTDSYEQAYSGMLAWELAMLRDLSPLFVEPPQPAPVEAQTLATTTATTTQTATSTKSTASSTSTRSTTTVVLPAPVQTVLQSGFVDKILENHDTRLLQTSGGETYFLWTFLDRGTILITTNQNTLKEVILRTHEAPIIPALGE